MGQRIERALGLVKAQRKLGSRFLADAGVEQPQQQRSRRFGRRRGSTADIEHSTRSGAAHGPLDLAPNRRCGSYIRDQCLEVLLV